MPDETPQLPETGRLVDDPVLYANGMTGFNGLRGYGGMTDPQAVWSAMVSGQRTALEYYRELEIKDDTVGDAIEEMKRSVLKRNLTVVPLDSSDSLAAEIAGFIQSQFDGVKAWRTALDAMLDAPFYGFSVAEQVFDVSSGQVSLIDVRDCPQQLFSFNDLVQPQTGPLRLHKSYGDYSGTLVPENKFAVWTSGGRAGDRRGRPLLREVFWPSWINRNVLRFWMRFVERGPGTAVTEYAQGATDAEKRQALAAAEALVNTVAMAIPNGMIIHEELLQVARSQDPAAYAQLSDRMESRIIRRIVGSTLTSKGGEDGKGTQALGKVHATTKDERSVEYALQLETLINSQIVRQLVLWNYGPDAPAVRVRLDKSDEEDLGERITVDDSLQQMGLPIGESYVRSKYGIPAPADGEAVLVRTAAPSSLTTPAGPPDAPQFADAQDGADPTITRQVHREQSDFDRLFAQMRGEGAALYKQRIQQLADQAARERNVQR